MSKILAAMQRSSRDDSDLGTRLRAIDQDNLRPTTITTHFPVGEEGRGIENALKENYATDKTKLNHYVEKILPLAKEYNAAVIGLCMDDDGIPGTPEKRLEVAKKIVERAGALGIGPENILIDCLALTVGADSQAGWITLEAMRTVKEELGVNLARQCQENKKLIAAICAAPACVLAPKGFLTGKRATCYPGFERSFGADAQYEDRDVVVDDNIITSRTPDDLPPFMRAIIGALK